MYHRCQTTLKDQNFLNFLFRGLYVRDLSYNDILETAGYIPHDRILFSEIGRLFHWVAERIFMQHTRIRDCLSFYEIYPCKFCKQNNKNHCDNSILVNDEFRSLSNFTFNISKSIKMVNIDYFLGSSEKYIKKHCQKGYQDKFKYLVLMPLNLKEPQETHQGVPYRHNIIVLDPTSFTQFFGVSDDLTKEFLEAVEISKKATYNSKYFEKLKKISEESKSIIRRDFNFKQAELEKELVRDLSLLGYNTDKSSLEHFF